MTPAPPAISAIPATTAAPPDSPSAGRDLQRQTLEQIVRLSIECCAQEQRVEQQHTAARDQENTAYQKTVAAAAQRQAQRVAELSASTAQRQAAIQGRYDTQQQAAAAEHRTTLQRIAGEKEAGEGGAKRELEQARWLAESVLEGIETQTDMDERQNRQDHVTRLAELAAQENAVQATMVRYEMTAFRVDAPLDNALKKRLATAPAEVLAEQQARTEILLQEFQTLSPRRRMAGAVPYGAIVVATAIVAAGGWFIARESSAKLVVAGGAGLVTLALGVAILAFHRRQSQDRAAAVYEPLMESLAIARQASTALAQTGAPARLRHIKAARRKCAQEMAAARNESKPILHRVAERYRTALAAETRRYRAQVAALEQEKQKGLEELERDRAQVARQIAVEDAATRQEAQAQHTGTLAAIETEYETACHNLAARWSDGLRAVTELLAAGSGIDPRLVDWNNPAWEQWQAPIAFSGLVRFGEMKVDLAQLTEHVPARLQLPETFTVPALLALPAHTSLLVEADHAGRGAAIDVAQMVMARLLTQMPAGRVKFTIFDPVGLGQSFAGFMHLADHDESLVGARIWTESEHLQQRLTDLTEHMETVIQKYLRNEYATIDQYNAQAGELAEPIRFLVIADFPTGIEPDALRRLTSIATTGPRCGVYTIILRDMRQPLPPGSRMEEIIARSVHLLYKDGTFAWDDAVFGRFPLRVDRPPDEKVLTRLMDLVGKAAKEAKRVEVPFASIAPPDDQFWSLSSKNDLRVPIGKSGATRLQALRLGVGVAQHALVAGKTGSGKSNLMHTIVTNLAMWYGPDEVEFYLVDFKKGVEFKAYASSQLPHARAIAVESDREFGLSVLQRVDAELTRRGTLFRAAGAQEIAAYRDRTGEKLPRTVLLIDEFQEFFSEDDKLGQEASVLLDRLVRQGRAFGVHVILGSQTIGGSSGLARSTLGQIAVRVALQCTEADSQMILGDNNSAARLLTRPGEAVYNDAGGLVEANSPFQIAFLPDQQREVYLERVHALCQARGGPALVPIVFEGNSAAAIRKNPRLMALLERPTWPPPALAALAYVGEPVAIKEPTGIPFRRQSGANVLLVGQQEESAAAMFASMVASIAAQQRPGDALFYVMDGSPADSRCLGLLERVMATIPHETKVVGWRQVPEAINELSTILKERQGNDAHAGPAVYLLVFGLQRYRLLRHQEDNFSFSRSEEPAPPQPDKQFATLLSEGPALGLHTIIWADTPITLERTLERSAMRQFDHRILFQMSASDSSNLIDAPLANRLGAHRALLYSEEQGTFEKCRPYELPDDAWLAFLAQHLKHRPG